MQSGIFQTEGNFPIGLQVYLTVLVGCKGLSEQLGDISKEESNLSSVCGGEGFLCRAYPGTSGGYWGAFLMRS